MGTGVNIKLLVVQVAGLFVAMGLALFIPAGTFTWAAGWAFLIMFFVFTVVLTAWLLRNDPGLLTERMTGFQNPEQKDWDKVGIKIMHVLFFGWFIIMGLDAVRFGWSQMPAWLQVVGAVMLLVSFYLFFLVFRENSFLSPAVRVQQDRGQTVVSTGPYRYVRHPMYAAAALFMLGTTLLLGSWIGVAIALLMIVLMAGRSLGEEETLRAELQGYDAYMGQVKYRLIPRVW